MNLCTIFRYSVLLGALFSLFACGGGGGTTTSQNTVINGIAQAGVFKGATVKIYGCDATTGNQNRLITTPASITTDSNGKYQATISNYTGAVVVKVFGTYRDEASGKDITVPEANALQAALPSTSGTVNMTVTPLTDLAVRKAQDAGSIKDNIANANQAISTLFGVDIIATSPVAPTASALQDATVTDSQKKYTIALAAISQYVANNSSTPTSPTATDLENALTQLSAGMTTTGGTPQVTSSQVAFNLQQAATEIVSNPNTQAVVTAAGYAGQNSLTNFGTAGNTTGNKVLAIKLTTQGSFTGTIIGTQADITLPNGVTLPTDSATGAILADAVVASGSAVGSTAAGKVSSGVLTVGIVNGIGFSIGEFATIYCNVPVSSTLTAADFTVTNVNTKDTNGATIDGITMTAGN